MHVYSVIHQQPGGVGAEPLTTVVSPAFMTAQDAAALAYSRHPAPITQVRQFYLDYPEVSDVPAVALGQVAQRYAGCARCHLAESRDNVVNFRGDPEATVVFVGEGPGRDEDLHGQPFIGRSGKLQDAFLRESGIPPESAGFLNLSGCRPCDARHDSDRPPTIVEIAACSERFLMLLRAIRPRVVVCLGGESSAAFFAKPPPPNTWFDIPGPASAPQDWIRVGVARHPAYLLRVIAMQPQYKEYFGARLFYAKLQRMIADGLTKVSRWHFGLQFLSGIQTPVVGGRP